MNWVSLLNSVPIIALAFFRIAGLMLFAPLFGSARVPQRVKLLVALALTASMAGSIPRPAQLPSSSWELAVGIAGELAFGLAMGTILSTAFVAAQWGGQLISQQMGLNISEVLDPQFGNGGSVVGDMYYMLCTAVFLLAGGHRELVRGMRISFQKLPLLSLTMNQHLLDLMVQVLSAATSIGARLAAPMLITMLVIDLVMGAIGKTVPQLNIMSAGLIVRASVGIVVLALGLGLTVQVLQDSMASSTRQVELHLANDPAALSSAPQNE
jgi:flagellar biosynthetic protein FliR